MTEHKAKMAPRPDAPPGIETDGHGNVIPLAQRTPEDQAKAQANIVGGSVKNPENEAQNPSPMPRNQQGQGGHVPDRDPEGRQGGTH